MSVEVPFARVLDQHCSDGTIRNRLLAAWRSAAASLERMSAATGGGVEVTVADRAILTVACAAAGEPDRLSFEVETHATPPLHVALLLPGLADTPDRERVVALAEATIDLVRRLFDAEVRVHMLASNMAHEVALLLAGTGVAVRVLEQELEGFEDKTTDPADLGLLRKASGQIVTDSRLGLYLVRNFLSATASARYGRIIGARGVRFSLDDVLGEMLTLYERLAAARGIAIRRDPGDPALPMVRGNPDEIKRAIHNVLSNAIKYSYRSVPGGERYVQIRAKVYDPGFRKPRFGLEFSNFGLGLSDDEQKRVFQHGFRGEQAIREVAVGSGIGLSEVQKIMQAHGGGAKLVSRRAHHDEPSGQVTYVTTVTLIFPLVGEDQPR